MSKSRTIAGAGVGVAIGVLFGFYILAPNVEGGPAGNSSSLQAELDDERSAREIAVNDADASDEVVSELAAQAVAGSLKDQRLAVFSFPDANPDVVNRLKWLAEKAGATVPGTVTLTESMVEPESGDRLKSIAANSLPAGAQLNEDNLSPGMHAGQLLGAAVTGEIPVRASDDKSDSDDGGDDAPRQASETDRGVVFGALQKEGVLKTSGELDDIDLAVVVTGGSDDGYVSQFEADFAAGVDSQLGGVVLASDDSRSAQSGAVGVVRGDKNYSEEVSTVDNVDRAAGRITTVRALKQQAKGDAGHYGAGTNAKAATLR